MSLSLVYNSDNKAYPEKIIADFIYHDDPVEAHRYKDNFQRAAATANLADYKIFLGSGSIEMRFASKGDKIRFSAALNPDDKVELDYFNASRDVTNRSLDRTRKALQKILKRVGLTEDIAFGLDRKNKTIILTARNGYSFILFEKAFGAFPERSAEMAPA